MRNRAKRTMLLTYLINFVLVLVLASNISAIAYEWDGGGDPNKLWTVPANWKPDGVPTSADTAQISVKDANCLIDSTVTAACLSLNVGINVGPCYLNMTGGTLKTAGAILVGDGPDGNGVFIMSSGDVNITSGKLQIGDGTNDTGVNPSYGTLIMTGGVIHVSSDAKLELGKNKTGTGWIYMNGGTVNLAGDSTDFEFAVYGTGFLHMTAGDINIVDKLRFCNSTPGGTGTIYMDGGNIYCNDLVMDKGTPTIYLDGGLINCSDDITMSSDNALIDITEGELIAESDDQFSVIEGYVGAGKIIGYGGAGIVDVVLSEGVIHVTARLGDPNLAWGPSPGNGATIAWTPTGPTLSWKAGRYAASHRVYFDPNEQKVIDRSGCAVNGVSRTEPNYTIIAPLSPLALGQTYYWAIDEVNEAGPDPCIWRGDVWKFTVADHIVVEDFDSYANKSELEAVWKLSGSDISIDNQIIRSGNSMKYHYTNNYSPFYTEAYANTTGPNSLQLTQDWTTAGIKALALYFYGKTTNATEQMYVALRDTANTIAAVYYNGDPNDIKEPQWHEWNIELSDFNDINNVNLSSIDKVYIGFGNRYTPQQGGTGVVYFDDIRLYPTRCVPSLAPAGDLDNDCDVDYVDVNMMASSWLEMDYNGVGSDGVLHNFPTDNSQWLNDPERGRCLQFDGINDWVDLNDSQFSNFHNKTISLWVKVREFPSDSRYIFFFSSGGSPPYRIYLLTRPGQPLIRARFIDQPYSDYSYTVINKWHHLVFVLRDTDEGCTGEFYGDGYIYYSWERQPRHSGGATGVNLGSSNDGGSGFINAVIDDFRVYDRALSESEIYSLYDGVGPTDKMLLHYTFDETSGLIAHNSSTYEFYHPLLSASEIYQGEAQGKRIVNFKDFAILADSWLEIQLWP